jgi:hypothetical protein
MPANAALTDKALVTVTDVDVSTTGTVTSEGATWVDMGGYHRGLCLLIHTIGTGTIDQFTIQGSAAVTGSSPAAIVSHAATAVPDALGDFLVLEFDHNDLVKAGEQFRYVSANVQQSVNTDEWLIVWVREPARYGAGGLTSDTIA